MDVKCSTVQSRGLKAKITMFRSKNKTTYLQSEDHIYATDMWSTITEL